MAHYLIRNGIMRNPQCDVINPCVDVISQWAFTKPRHRGKYGLMAVAVSVRVLTTKSDRNENNHAKNRQKINVDINTFGSPVGKQNWRTRIRREPKWHELSTRLSTLYEVSRIFPRTDICPIFHEMARSLKRKVNAIQVVWILHGFRIFNWKTKAKFNGFCLGALF